MLKPMLVLITTLILTACGGPVIEDYRDGTPRLKAERFFSGPLTAHGIVKDRSGEVIRTFNAELTGQWQNGRGELRERFVFDDGEVQYRTWTLTPQPAAGIAGEGETYIGRAGDVVGDARVRTLGNAMFINYTLRIPYDGETLDVVVDDRMYRVSDKVLINESRLSKWGFYVGEIVLTIIKH